MPINKQANELYTKKILLNFPMVFRPVIADVLGMTKGFFVSNNAYLNYLKALIVGEPSDIIKINHSKFPKVLMRIKNEYRNDFFYIVAKAKEFIPSNYFMKYIDKLHEKNIEFR